MSNTDDDIRARLQRMVAEDRNGANAARLLQNLTVFQGLFPRAAVIAMTPDDMSEAERIEAFATLCQWRLVRKISQRRYRIDEAIKSLYPPSRDLLMRYLTYCEKHFSSSDDIYLYLYWDDIIWALVWGLQHWPEKAEELRTANRWRIWLLHQAQSPHLVDMLDQFVKSISLSESFPPKVAHDSRERWQDQVLEHLITIGPHSQLYYTLRRAEAAHMNQNIPLARQYYEKAAVLIVPRANPARAWIEETMVLEGLCSVLIRQKDTAAFYTYVDQLLPLIQGRSDSLRKLGLMMVKIDDRPAARRCFARGLDLNQPQDHYRNSLLFRDWGRLENADGHFQEATVLYGLALTEAMHRVEQCTERYELGDDIARTLARIEEAWRNLERLNQEWRMTISHRRL